MARKRENDPLKTFTNLKPNSSFGTSAVRCPKCKEKFGPLQITSHREKCDGITAPRVLGTRPGRVPSPSFTVSGSVYRREKAIEAAFMAESAWGRKLKKKGQKLKTASPSQAPNIHTPCASPAPRSLSQLSVDNMKTVEQDPLAERPNLDFSKGVRGKYSNLLAEGTNVVILDPALLSEFPDSQSVNDALHAFLTLSANQRAAALTHHRSQPEAFPVSPDAFDPRTGRNSKTAAYRPCYDTSRKASL